MLFEAVGWVGGMLLAVCGIPQTIKTVKDGHARGLAWSFLLMWFGGEILSFIYLLPTENVPMLINLGVNTIFTSIIIYYKKNERRKVVYTE